MMNDLENLLIECDPKELCGLFRSVMESKYKDAIEKATGIVNDDTAGIVGDELIRPDTDLSDIHRENDRRVGEMTDSLAASLAEAWGKFGQRVICYEHDDRQGCFRVNTGTLESRATEIVRIDIMELVRSVEQIEQELTE